MQKERVGGFKDFIKDVKEGKFPEKHHIVSAPDGLINDFLKKIENK